MISISNKKKLKLNTIINDDNSLINIQKSTSLSLNNNSSTLPSSSIIMTAKKMTIKSSLISSSPTTTIISDNKNGYPFENLYCQCKHHITN